MAEEARKNKAGSYFVLFPKSRNTTGLFRKNYLQRDQLKFYSVSHAEIPEFFNITSKHFSIFNNMPPASLVERITSDFLTC